MYNTLMTNLDSFRSNEMIEKYTAYKATGKMDHVCHLCVEKPLRSYKFWKIVPNNFPYDLIAKRHEMIVPIRHADESGLTNEEWSELHEIRYGNLQEYDLILEVTRSQKSIPTHFHQHLIDLKLNNKL